MKWTAIIYHVIQFLAVCAGTYTYKRLAKPTKILFWLLVYTFISELVALYIKTYYGNNVYVYHIYNPVQYTLITYAFYLEMRQYRFMFYSIFLFWVFALINGIFWEPFLEMFCANLSMTKSILTSFWTLLYFYELLKNVNEHKFLDYPLVWISIGLLVFNVTNIVGLGLFNVLSSKDILTEVIRNVRSFTNYLLYSSFIGAFFCRQKTISYTK
ncbi:hypothetical protein [Runella sp.]|uniref:hypothetical protein n=1 Tax=Runella sp. TaxID=1960881 RepID=UPI003D0B0978